MKAKQLVKLIEAAGWEFQKQEGSHMIFSHPDFRRPIPVPNHGSKDLGKGLVHKILKQAGLR
jgi:predicted RNA binding protein YcfA (HicA-like mRNA interferase family)